MVDTNAENEARVLDAELDWLARVLAKRLLPYIGQSDPKPEEEDTEPPTLAPGTSRYAEFAAHYDLGFAERLVLGLCLAPLLRPRLLDPLFIRNSALERGHSEFGGITGRQHSGFLPTVETALFLLAGDDLAVRIGCQALFDGRHPLTQLGIIKIRPAPEGESPWAGQLTLSSDIFDYLTTGQPRIPVFGPRFPARRITTQETWDDLVLEHHTLQQVLEIQAWIRHGSKILDDWGLGRRIKPGMRSLFYGPPGTGKTMTASLLGVATGCDVYRIDLSLVISKYIGETEKNLAQVFDRAEGRDWILFFDEADALFGKRTDVRDARDRFANQQVAYLLQRVEDYDGVVILASNLKGHIDEAFTRRFHSIIHFAMPSTSAREQLWRKAVTGEVTFHDDVDVVELADRYELSGGAIMNVVRYAALMAAERDSRMLQAADIQRGIQRELEKEGRSL